MENIIKQKREITVYSKAGETIELVEIYVDLEHLARRLGTKAFRNKDKKATIYNAGVTVRHIGRIKPEPGPGNGP